MQHPENNILACEKYEADIAQQKQMIAELEQTVAQKEDEISRISQEYESAAKDLQASIHYAERIQRAVIPQDAEFKALFPDCFIYFSPRDIVSGDFYTCASSDHCKIAIVADCTGHGVPGGLLSMLGMSALKDLLSKQKISSDFQPGEILDSLRKFILTSLAEADESDDTTVSDGMDFTLCVFNNEMTQIRYACANHTIYVARDGEITKLKGDRMPIGRHPRQDTPFESFTFDLQKGDMVYLCSDGIQDQFGSPANIKFTTKRLALMLQEHCNEDTQTQYDNLSKIVNDWKVGREQFDDQTLIGIRI
ncbi:MAG: SpoIIE family protein phosphatase [Bacteroidales bacterium]|nr:SpoIIE family protein phosphatase [Bacteroidales bacterium]MBR4272702.1 SpoIIE family protein phosphatase [Bacteroidales bacterium]